MPAETLRPMRLGELLDRTFSLYRRNFLLFTGIMVVPVLVMSAFNVMMQLAQGPTLAAQAAHQPPNPAVVLETMSTFGPLILLALLFYCFAFALAHGAVVFATSQVFLGRSATIGALFRAARLRIWKLLGLGLLVILRMSGYFALLGIAAALVVAAAVALGKVAGAILIWPLMVGAVLAGILIGVRYCLAAPALLLEDTRISEAIRRSVSLVQGHRFRAFLIFLTVMVVAYAGLFLFSAPFTVAQFYLVAQGAFPPFWLRALGAIGAGLSQVLTLPLGIIAFVVFYFDIRVRKEGLDLQLMIGSLGSVPGAPGVDASLPSPAPPGDLPSPPPARAPGSLGL